MIGVVRNRESQQSRGLLFLEGDAEGYFPPGCDAHAGKLLVLD